MYASECSVDPLKVVNFLTVEVLEDLIALVYGPRIFNDAVRRALVLEVMSDATHTILQITPLSF